MAKLEELQSASKAAQDEAGAALAAYEQARAAYYAATAKVRAAAHAEYEAIRPKLEAEAAEAKTKHLARIRHIPDDADPDEASVWTLITMGDEPGGYTFENRARLPGWAIMLRFYRDGRMSGAYPK